ncbi:MAG: hypothetical protein HY578_04345 [Nitrospinae bacterium]|nr:hypothetical protein [Nitrospinota bacterium]
MDKTRYKTQNSGLFHENSPMRLLILVFVFLISLSSKPLPPVDIIMELERQPEVPGLAIINVKVTPLIEQSDLNVQIELPEGLKLFRGVERWNGILEVNKMHTFQYQVYIPDKKIYEIKASVTLRLLTGETVKREEGLEIIPEGVKRELKKLPEKKGKDRGVIEFKGGDERKTNKK